MKAILQFATLVTIFLVSCSSNQRPIEYGKDNCAFCKMTIMDNKFGAELVTSKGKVFTFDSGECLVRYVKLHKSDNEDNRYFVTDFDKPGVLVETRQAIFVHGPGVQSPMGGNLAAFKIKLTAQHFASLNQGGLLTWEQLLQKAN